MMPNIGDLARIRLAGILAMEGPVITRQSAMDAERHGVQIIGKSLSWQLVKSSVAPKDANFDGMNLEQITRKIAAAVAVGVGIVGTPDPTPFRIAQASAGEVAIDFIEHLARDRGTVIGSDSVGDLLLIGLHKDTDDDDWFIEGKNIKSINVV